MSNKTCLTLLMVLLSCTPVKNAFANKSQIIDEVLTEKGFYDANEIEKRLRFEALDEPLKQVGGVVKVLIKATVQLMVVYLLLLLVTQDRQVLSQL